MVARDVGSAIGYSLIIGVVVSVALIALGSAMLFIHGGGGGYSLAQISSVHSPVNTAGVSIGDIVAGLPSMDGISLIYLGLIVLIATPVVRVVLLLASFAAGRNRLYTVLSAIVLFNLLVGILVIPMYVHPLA